MAIVSLQQYFFFFFYCNCCLTVAVVAPLLPARSRAPRCSRGPDALGVFEGVIDLIVVRAEAIYSSV